MSLSKLWPSRFIADYGMLGVLLLVCLYFSWATFKEQQLSGEDAAAYVAQRLPDRLAAGSNILIAGKGSPDALSFAAALKKRAEEGGYRVVEVVAGDPPQVRKAFERIAAAGVPVEAIATTQDYAPVVESIKGRFPALAPKPLVVPPSFRWPTFLLADNLLNVANQIVVIAIIAIGMTMVIVAGGIDLSVGSLVGLSSVTVASLMVWWGAENASLGAMVLASCAGMAVCGAVGLFSGAMVTMFRVPPFIATLAVMQVARGCAFIISKGEPIYQIPNSYVWLGRGTDLLSIPNAVVLMVLLYGAAHILMSRTTLGRYVYAVGGNAEAARLSGVNVPRMQLLVYTVCGLVAGLGGVIMTSQLRSGDPKYGDSYELFVIAAVVVGGTSLSGGEGKVMGTLIGAFLIAVINNGMNLTRVESYTQKVVLGLVILGAVLLDMLKKGGRLRFVALRKKLGLRS
jgi:ribose transport system permease protein